MLLWALSWRMEEKLRLGLVGSAGFALAKIETPDVGPGSLLEIFVFLFCVGRSIGAESIKYFRYLSVIIATI